MAANRYPGTHTADRRQRLFLMEGALALSVIAGLGFVTFRVMNIGAPASPPQSAATFVVSTDASPLATTGSETKTP